MDISVVLGTYNRAASLQTALETFSRLVVDPGLCWELLVVDNNSTDRTPEVIQSFAEAVSFPVRYIFERQQGRSAALNAGIAEAKGKIVAFTDDDVLLHCDWLSNLAQTFDKFDCAAAAGRVIPQWNHAKPNWVEMNGQFAVVNFDLGDDCKEIRIPPLGANSAFRKDIFRKYGLFRLDLGVTGSKHTITCDDTEFGERLIRGWRQNYVLSPCDYLSSRRFEPDDENVLSLLVLLQRYFVDQDRRPSPRRHFVVRRSAMALSRISGELGQMVAHLQRKPAISTQA
jgi:glycosyltransferase involved in cell wall biosynthesis